MKFVRLPDSSVHCPRWHYRRAIIPLSSNCTSSKARCSRKKQLEIGVVKAIAAPASLKIEIEGEGGHAGAVLMPDRRDAFLAAAEIALAVEAAVKSTGSRDTVGTCGVCDVFPGAVNSIPSRVHLEVDVRDIDLARRDSVLRSIAAATEEIVERRRVTVRTEVVNADAPAMCAPAHCRCAGTAPAKRIRRRMRS